MSKLNIGLKTRVVRIKVEHIRARDYGGVTGLPKIEIQDDKGKSHTISAVDVSPSEFDKIKPGTTIQVQVRENWTNLKVLN